MPPSVHGAVTKGKTLLIVGDSLSAGYGVPLETSWVQLLQDRLQQRAAGITVINASVSGETTLGGRNRLAALLRQHKPSWLLLELGANDGLRGLPLADMEANLEAMIRMAQTQGSTVILIGMRLPPNYGAVYTNAFVDLFRTLAERHRCALVPFLLQGIASDLNLMQADGLHPNAMAQARLLDNVWPTLESVLGLTTDSSPRPTTTVETKPKTAAPRP